MATSDELEDERMESLRYLFLYFQKRFVIPPLPWERAGVRELF